MMLRRTGAVLAVFLLTAAAPTRAAAAQDGPALPTLPDTISRDESGRPTIRAVRLDAPLEADGRLDEPVYRTVHPASDFVQTDPVEGAAATEKTEVWVFFDRENLYVSARVWETRPEQIIVSDMRRDGALVYLGGDTFSFIIDTFYDRRNGTAFIINPLGGRQDGQVTNERWNRDWNTVWDFGLGRFDDGWTVEFVVPFKSLRYRPGGSQLWGFNARRVSKWKNEVSHLAPVPIASSGNGLFRTSLAGTLVGLELPSGSKNLDVKPYAISNVATDRVATPRISNDVDADVGVDVKYGLTQNLTADFTYNTDFAQVEADEQQVNLTRFNLFFPEKREFFLENPGLFTFGGIGTGNQGVPAGDAPLLFYSRRIGLNQGRVVPIEAGGRFTGRVGRYTLGIVNIQTDDDARSASAATNFSVLRVRRDVLRKSSIGVMATGRSVTVGNTGSNQAYGVDGVFSFFDNLNINAYWARTRTTALGGDDASYRAALEYGGDRYGLELEHLTIGEHFNPEVGFLRRTDIRRTSAQARFSPRPRNSRFVRRYSWSGGMAYVENRDGRVAARDVEGEFGIEFASGDRFTASRASNYELIPRPFRIASGIVLPVGGYDSGRTRVSYSLGQQRVLSGTAFVEQGPFYGGDRTALGFTAGRVRLTPQVSVEPSYSINKVELREGAFTTHLAGSRITYTVTPLMFVAALLQYNSSNSLGAANVRLRWEYAPGSELFVVYNEERDAAAARFPALANRAFIVKVNRLLRF